jgi:hypothetical protein
MFTQDLGATSSYRTVARGFGGGWARTYQVLKQDHDGQCDHQRRDLGRPRRLSSTSEVIGKQVEQRRQALPRGDGLSL